MRVNNKSNESTYILTRHVQERFQERFQHLFNNIEWGNNKKIKQEMLELLKNAKENNSFRNNPRFMFNVYEKYGYNERFKFLCNGIITFVVVIKPGGKEAVVTCFNGSGDRYITKHKKFKKKKRDKVNKDSLNIIDLEETRAMGWNIGLKHFNGASY